MRIEKIKEDVVVVFEPRELNDVKITTLYHEVVRLLNPSSSVHKPKENAVVLKDCKNLSKILLDEIEQKIKNF